MKTRVISSVGLGVALLIVLQIGGIFMASVLLVVSMIAFFELMRATGVHEKGNSYNMLEACGYMGITFHYCMLMLMGEDLRCFIASTFFVFFTTMFVFVFTFPKYHIYHAMSVIFSFIYAPLMLSCIYLLRIKEWNGHPIGKFLCWIPFVAWISDTFAYLTGRAFGKHKLCPKLSPAKTVEGAVGGILFSGIAGVVFGFIISNFLVHDANMIWIFGLITLVAGAISQVGDLAASGLKRNMEIKDYGHLIPGHGGIMDRFDSVIFTTPAIFLLTTLLLK